MQWVCVFCGANRGDDRRFAEAAQELGRLLAERGLGLVYGGGGVGLMGVLADAALEAGAKVKGVIPEALATKELAHAGLTELFVVPSMHARKALMAELADAFVALPGGFGTFEELFEVVTWAQLGLHDKAVGALDVAGYFAPLKALVQTALQHGFIKQDFRDLIVVDDDAERLLDTLAKHRTHPAPRWLSPNQS